MGIIKRIVQFIQFRMESDLMHWDLEVECPHTTLEPCDDCYNMSRALGW
jgi:hypothetical protein